MLLWANGRGGLGGGRTDGRGQQGGRRAPHLHLVPGFTTRTPQRALSWTRITRMTRTVAAIDA